jgi:phosphoribosylaminoimidazole-succinocarboxamide synthase
MKLVKKGSVKDIYTDDKDLFFKFSNRYSIFDWGEMPDQIPRKGDSLLRSASSLFKLLEDKNSWNNWDSGLDKKMSYYVMSELSKLKENGANTHYLGITSHDGDQFLKVLKCLVPDVVNNDKIDYSFYKSRVTKTLVPLEIVFRFGVPSGSSLLKRAANESYLKLIGLDSAPKTGDEFDFPVIEFSTKLESTDRYISYEEAKNIAGLSCSEFEVLRASAVLFALRLKDFFKSYDLKLWDGKFEFGFNEITENGHRDFMLVDSIGPDELRLTNQDVPVSKEIMRKFYRDSEWHKNIESSKDLARIRNVQDWKSICKNEFNSTPEKLQDEDLKLLETMYQCLTFSENKSNISDVINEISRRTL